MAKVSMGIVPGVPLKKFTGADPGLSSLVGNRPLFYRIVYVSSCSVFSILFSIISFSRKLFTTRMDLIRR